jgi:DNA repair protein RadC
MVRANVPSDAKPSKAAPSGERPRERLCRFGVESLSDAELLALVLGTGRRGEPVSALAVRVLGEFGGPHGLLQAGRGNLAKAIGLGRAARLIGAAELVRRAAAQRLDPHTPYSSSQDVIAAFAPLLADQPDERVMAVVLDARQRPVAERQLAAGGPASCSVGVRQIFALAVREGGAGVILVHNHPSGNPTPSTEDLTLTQALANAGHVLELPLVDHVILGREGSFSFLDAGLLPITNHGGTPPKRGG